MLVFKYTLEVRDRLEPLFYVSDHLVKAFEPVYFLRIADFGRIQ